MYFLTRSPETQSRTPWNKAKLVGQKPPLKLKEIWSIRVRLQIANRIRDLALFNLAIDSKLKSCDLLNLRVRDICYGTTVSKRAMVTDRRLSGRSNLKLWIKPEILFQNGFHMRNWPMGIIFSKVDINVHLTYLAGNIPYRKVPGIRCWARSCGLRHTFAKTHKGITYLSANEEPESGSTIARACKAGKYGSIPGH